MDDHQSEDRDLPPAAQWMREQAAADQARPQRATPETTYTPLAEREARVVGGLRGNERLTVGLDQAAAGALTAWGEALARRIVADTAGLDDAAAEEVLQTRVRATRRLMMWVRDSAAGDSLVGDPTETNLAEALALAEVAYGAQAGRATPVANRPAGKPAASSAAQVALLRRYIEAHLSRGSEARETAG